MASVTYRLKTPTREETTIICRFYSKETGPLDFSTGEKIPTKYWTGSAVSAKYKRDPDRINKSLSILAADLLEIWRNNKGAEKAVLKSLITQAVKGGSNAEKKTVISAVRLFIAQYEREKEKTTAGRYKVLLRKLEAFNPNLTFEQLDQNFYDQFKQWLYGNDNPLFHGFRLEYNASDDCYTVVAGDPDERSIGLFDDVVFKYFVNIQTVIHWAEKRGYQINPSYKSWEIIKREYPIISLTLDELQRIEALDLPAKHLDIARDYLSICCRTGQRISDVKKISALAISSGSWTVHQKKGSRQKQKVVSLPLVGFCEPVIDIVNKYGGKLPEISEQRLNEHIKTVCKLAGITQEIYIERWQGNKKIRIPGKKYEYISTHSGKKTFITILGNIGIPVKVISDFTGTSIKTIEKHYLGRTELYVAESYLRKVESGNTIKKAI